MDLKSWKETECGDSFRRLLVVGDCRVFDVDRRCGGEDKFGGFALGHYNACN